MPLLVSVPVVDLVAELHDSVYGLGIINEEDVEKAPVTVISPFENVAVATVLVQAPMVQLKPAVSQVKLVADVVTVLEQLNASAWVTFPELTVIGNGIVSPAEVIV